MLQKEKESNFKLIITISILLLLNVMYMIFTLLYSFRTHFKVGILSCCV